MQNFKFYKFVIVAFWLTLFYTVFASSVSTKMSFEATSRRSIQYFFPQGWGFFTKDPKEALLDIYQLENNSLNKIELKNFSSANYWGLSRKSRIEGYEVSMILSTVGKTKWKDTVGLASSDKPYLPDSAITVKTNQPFKYFDNGEYLFLLRKPIPYEWAGRNQEKFAPYSVVRVKLVKI
jgi:antimicrobial peptide system SdpA family protein